MNKKSLLFISNLFPNPTEPQKATYNKQQISALSNYYDIDVISPIAWTDRFFIKNKVRSSRCGEIPVYHPTYFHIPKYCRSFYGILYYLSIKKRAEFLLRSKNYAAIFSSWLYPDSWAAARLAARFDIPNYVKVHGTDVNSLQVGAKVTKLSLSVVQSSTKTFCVSKALLNRLLSLGAPDDTLATIYNGIDINMFRPIKREEAVQLLNFPSLAESTNFLYVGNLKREKGLAELIKAFASIHQENVNCKLILVGKGPFESEFRKLTKELQLEDHVIMVGSQPQERVCLWMNSADLLCLPSYMEGVPNVILESLACGTQVVASRVGGIPELRDGCPEIVLCEPKSVESLKMALINGIQNKHADLTLPPFINSWEENARTLSRQIG